MAKVYVHIEASVAPDGKDAKAALKPAVKAKIQSAAITAITKGMPEKSYSTKNSDKPKKSKKLYDAIKATITIKVKIDTKGKGTTVNADWRMEFVAIKWPKTSKGSVLAAASKGGAVGVGGTDAKAIAGAADAILDATAKPVTKKVMSGSSFKKMAGNLGITVP